MIKKLLSRIRGKYKKGTELELIHVHTFRTGDKLYTYKPEDLGKAHSRYYRDIQEALNYIKTFALTKSEWTASIEAMKKSIKSATNGGDKAQALLDINTTLDYFDSKASGLKNSSETLYDSLFCMFYILEDENEMGYNKVFNQKKLELLDGEPEMRDFFFKSLKSVMDSSIGILKEDTLSLLRRMDQLQGALMFSNMQKS